MIQFSQKKQLAQGLSIAAVTALISLSSVLLPTRASALIELKGAYSLFNTNPSDLNDSFAGQPKIDQMQAISFDVMGRVPTMPVGLGVRHEMFSRDETGPSVKSKIDWKRTSILVNKRLIDTGIYLGPVATVSFASDFKYRSENGLVKNNYKTEATMTATAGVEAGFKTMLLSAGVEAGYLYAPMGHLRDSTTGADFLNGNGQKVDVNLSGPYLRATVGFGF